MNSVFYIVDDDPIFRKMISLMVQKIDPNVICKHCENGAIGLKKLEIEKEHTNKNKIIILLDINMPILNGWQFLKEIESNERFNITNVTLYVVSSSTDRADVLKAKQHTIVTHYFYKPLIDGDLQKILKHN